MDQHSQDSNNRNFQDSDRQGSIDSVESLLVYLRALTDVQMEESLRLYLKEGLLGERPVYTVLERHRFVAEIFNRCETVLQEKIRRVFASLLQNFEGTNPGDDPAYLFSLVSLASVIRSASAKERLRRWIRLGTFKGWKHGIFDLNSELIVATSAYDADDAWIDYMLKVYPKQPTFAESALATYAALWQTRGEQCLDLLPEIMATGNPADRGFSKSLGYHLRLTIRKLGYERFNKLTAKAFQDARNNVPTAWLAILTFDELLDSELAKHNTRLTELTDQFEGLWAEAVKAWRALPDLPAHAAFARMMDVPSKESITIKPGEVRAAFRFRKQKYGLEIYESDTYIIEHSGNFFEDIEQEYQVQGVGA